MPTKTVVLALEYRPETFEADLAQMGREIAELARSHGPRLSATFQAESGACGDHEFADLRSPMLAAYCDVATADWLGWLFPERIRAIAAELRTEGTGEETLPAHYDERGD